MPPDQRQAVAGAGLPSRLPDRSDLPAPIPCGRLKERFIGRDRGPIEHARVWHAGRSDRRPSGDRPTRSCCPEPGSCLVSNVSSLFPAVRVALDRRPALAPRVWVWGLLLGCVTCVASAQPPTPESGSVRVGKLSPGLVSLAGLPTIQEELGVSVTPEAGDDLSQADLLKRLAGAMNEDFQSELLTEMNSRKVDLETSGLAERRRLNSRVERLRTTLNAAYLPKLKELLTDAQVQRLRELHWQLQGLLALQEPELVAQMQLTNQQINRIRTTISDAQTRINEAATAPFAGGGIERGGYGEMQKRISNIESERDRQLLDLLTVEQRRAYENALGKPFDRRKLTTTAAPPKQKERTKRLSPSAKPAEKPAETPTQTPTPTPADKSAASPPEKVTEKPAGGTATKPGETPQPAASNPSQGPTGTGVKR